MTDIKLELKGKIEEKSWGRCSDGSTTYIGGESLDDFQEKIEDFVDKNDRLDNEITITVILKINE